MLKMRIAQSRMRARRSLALLFSVATKLVATIVSFVIIAGLGLVAALVFLFQLAHVIYIDNSRIALVIKVSIIVLVWMLYQQSLHSAQTF